MIDLRCQSSAFENVHISLILISKFYDCVTVERVGRILRMRPASEVTQRRQPLGLRRLRRRAIVGHEHGGRHDRDLGTPGI